MRVLAGCAVGLGSLVLAAVVAVPASADPSVPYVPVPGVHHAYVAVMDNAGPYDVTDAQIEASVRAATDYWVDQTDGVVSAFPVTLRHFRSGFAGRDGCGLNVGTDYVWDEAAARAFPHTEVDGEGDHLIVIVPDECRNGFDDDGWASKGTGLESGGRMTVDGEWGRTTHDVTVWLGRNLGLGDDGVQRECLPDRPDICSFLGDDDDAYSVMHRLSDGTPPTLGGAERDALGLLQPSESVPVELSDDARTSTRHIRIVPRSAATGQRTVVVTDPEDGRRFYVDYRSATDGDAGSTYATDPGTGADYGYGALAFGPGVTVTSLNGNNDTRLWPLELGVSDTDGPWHYYRSVYLDDESFRSTDGQVVVDVDDVEPGRWADITVHVRSPDESFADPPSPTLVYLSDDQSTSSRVPDCQDTLAIEVHSSSWPPGTRFSYGWSLNGEPWVILAGRRPESSVRLSQPCPRGKVVQGSVTATAPGYRAVTLFTQAVGPVTRHLPGNVKIEGSLIQVGAALDVDAVFYPEYEPDRDESLQWYADGVPIPGATSVGYTPSDGDAGKLLTVTASAQAPGYDATELTSRAVGPVGASTPVAPTPVTPTPVTPTPVTPTPVTTSSTPSVAGAAQVGALLTAEPGTWSPGTSLRYSWQRGTTTIPGAQSAQYRPVAADVGAVLRVVVDGVAPGLDDVERTSDATPAVARGVLASSRPRVRGLARVGRTLRVDTGAWSTGTTFTYHWLAHGRVVRGATGSTYVVPSRRTGARIRVEITGSRPGYAPVTVLSRPSPRVRRAVGGRT